MSTAAESLASRVTTAAANSPPPPAAQHGGGYAPQPQENAQSGAKLSPPVETRRIPPSTSQSSQPAAATTVSSGGLAAIIETPPQPDREVLQHPASGGAEPAIRLEISPSPQSGEERALIAEGFALLVSEVRRTNRGGRPTVIDEPMKARISTLMGAGLSLRQAAACLGINHATISRALVADEQLKHDVEVARTRSTLHPLACILREAGKNWKAAVWLLEHLGTVAYNEKTPQEKAEISARSSAMTVLEHQLKERMVAEARASLTARKRGGQSPAP